MRVSLIAVVSRLGLESLLPECQGARYWLNRANSRRSTFCLWAVMERAQAGAIHDLLSAGEGEWALHELAFSAEFMGPLYGNVASNDQEAPS